MADHKLPDQAKAYLASLGQMFVEHLDQVGAPNYVEIALTDEAGDVKVIVTLARPNGDRPATQVARLRERLEAIENLARHKR